MSWRLEHKRLYATSAALLLCAVLSLGLAPSGLAAERTHRASTSPYPAGATRASLYPRPSQYARAASAGGTSAAGKRAKKKAVKKLRGNPARALAAFEAMQAHYYIKGSGLYEGEPFSYLWPFSQALAATVSMANIPHLGVSVTHELNARLSGGAAVRQRTLQQPAQHRHHRAGRRACPPALPADAQPPVPAVRRDGLRMGARLPAAAKRHVCRPHRPHWRYRTDSLELQPGHHDRRRHAALPDHRQLRIPLPGA